MLTLKSFDFAIEPEPGDASDKNQDDVKCRRAKTNLKRSFFWPRQAPHTHALNFPSHVVNLFSLNFRHRDES